MPNLLTILGLMMIGMAMGALLTAVQFRNQIQQLRKQQEELWMAAGPQLAISVPPRGAMTRHGS